MADQLSVTQASPPDYCAGSVMSNVELFPSSAVAQSHVPGSATHPIQQPPSQQTCHQRCASIFQNPSFDNKHSAYRKTTAASQQQQSSATTTTELQEETRTKTSTNTATDSAMMIDEPMAKIDATMETCDKAEETKAQPQPPQQQPAATEANAGSGDAGGNSAVRKVR